MPMKKPAQHFIAEVPRSITKVGMTIGIDLGDVWSHYCTLNEDGEVVDAFLLVRDRIGEAAPSPRIVALPGTARLLDELAHSGDDVVLAGLRLLRVQQQQNFVSRQVPRSSLPMVSMSAPTAGAARDGTAR